MKPYICIRMACLALKPKYVCEIFMVTASSLAHCVGLLEPRRLSKESYSWHACVYIYGFPP